MSNAFQELEARAAEIMAEVQGIDAQLSARKPVTKVPDSQHQAWRQWRGKALYARKCLMEEYREVKMMIKHARQEAHALRERQRNGEELDTPEGMINALLRACEALRAHEIPGFQPIMDAARKWAIDANDGRIELDTLEAE